MATTLIERLNKRRNTLFSERESEWDPHWKDLQRFVQPRLGRFDLSETNRGKKLNDAIIDTSARKALRVLVAGMSSGLTSPARPWFRLVTPDLEMMEFGPVRLWLHEVERRMRLVFQASNVYQALPMAYEELGCYGTSVSFWLKDFNQVIRGLPMTIGEYACAVGADQNIDTVYRRYAPTSEQVIGFFQSAGDKIPPQIRDAYDRSEYDKRYTIYHAVEPRSERDPSQADSRNKPWRSTYWMDGVHEPIRDAGFDDKPFTATRWDVTGLDTYGRSPGMDALGDAKQIQLQEKRKAQFIDKMVSPPMVANGQLKNGFGTGLPGGITYSDGQTGARSAFEPAYEMRPEGLNYLMQDMAETRNRINSAFFADLFLMISQMPIGGEKTTATEIAARQEEKMLMLGPVLERAQAELLNPLIDRTFAAMIEAGVLPPPPPELSGANLRVDYISVLAQAQKAVATTSVERLTGFVGNLTAVFPEVMDKYNADQAVDEYSDMLGVPPNIIRSDEDVERIRESRRQAEQQQQQTAALAQGADTAQVLSNTDTRGGNALSALLGTG